MNRSLVLTVLLGLIAMYQCTNMVDNSYYTYNAHTCIANWGANIFFVNENIEFNRSRV